MIETASSALIFLLICFAMGLVLAAVSAKVVEKCGEALRGWLG